MNPGIAHDFKAVMFPLLVSSTGILVGIATLLCVNIFFPVKDIPDIEKALKGVLIISTILETPVITGLAWWCLPAKFDLAPNAMGVTWANCAIPCLVGAWAGLFIGIVTEYYTSHSYRPVREISETQRVSAATGTLLSFLEVWQ